MDAINALAPEEIESEKNYDNQRRNTKAQLSSSTAQRVQTIQMVITVVKIALVRKNRSLTVLFARKETIITVANLVTSSICIARRLPMESDVRTILGITAVVPLTFLSHRWVTLGNGRNLSWHSASHKCTSRIFRPECTAAPMGEDWFQEIALYFQFSIVPVCYFR